MDPLLDACADLLLTQHHLAARLHTAGLLGDQAATAILAREDQLDATLNELRNPASRPAELTEPS